MHWTTCSWTAEDAGTSVSSSSFFGAFTDLVARRNILSRLHCLSLEDGRCRTQTQVQIFANYKLRWHNRKYIYDMDNVYMNVSASKAALIGKYEMSLLLNLYLHCMVAPLPNITSSGVPGCWQSSTPLDHYCSSYCVLSRALFYLLIGALLFCILTAACSACMSARDSVFFPRMCFYF